MSKAPSGQAAADADAIARLHAEMARTNRLLAESEGLRGVLRGIASRAREITSADYAAIALFDDEPLLERFTYVGMDDELARALGRPPIGRGLLGALAHAEGALRLDDLQSHPSFTGWPDGHPDMCGFLGVPVRAGETSGALYVTRIRGREPFSDFDQLAASTLALQAALIVAQALDFERTGRIGLLEERVRIAHDLHDGTIQSLYALGLELETAGSVGAGDPAPSEAVDRAVDRINGLIQEIREYITTLEAPTPANEPELTRDIPYALRQLVPEGIDTIVNLSPPALLDLDSRDVEDIVYIVREAVSNAVRHGSPTKIGVDLRPGEDGVVLAVQDNGAGFDPATARMGMGTISMRSRAEHLGGELAIIGIPGMGATVRLRIQRSR